MPEQDISGRAEAPQGATVMTDPVESRPRRRGPGVGLVLLGFAAIAGITVLLLPLLTNICERKQEARQPFVKLVEVTEDIDDPKVWGQNWPFQYDSYLRTAESTTTKYGGGGAGAGGGGPRPDRNRQPHHSAPRL